MSIHISMIIGSFSEPPANPFCTDQIFSVEASSEPKYILNQSKIFAGENVVSSELVSDAFIPDQEKFKSNIHNNPPPQHFLNFPATAYTMETVRSFSNLNLSRMQNLMHGFFQKK